MEKPNIELTLKELVSLGYMIKTPEDFKYEDLFNFGAPSLNFVNIVTWISIELRKFYHLESCISQVNDTDELGSNALGFLVEISSLLKELNCPIKRLVSGSIEERLLDADNKNHCLSYLCGELAAAKMLAIIKPEKQQQSLQIELEESETAKCLKEMLISLRFSRPPDNIGPQMLFSELEKKLYMLSHPQAPKVVINKVLFSGTLTSKQWFQLEHLYKEMFEEYKNRKSLLLTRLDVTVQSFLWADKSKDKADKITNAYQKLKSGITALPTVRICDVLAATSGFDDIEKTSSASVRKNTKSKINTVIIGSVPDRGGRPNEQKPPPPEVPSWQQTSTANRQHDFKNQGNRQVSQQNYNYQQQNQSYQSHYNSNFDCSANNSYPRGNFHNPVNFVGNSVNLVGNSQPGFGGYAGPVSDNFQQFGANDRLQSANYSRGGGQRRNSRSTHGRFHGGRRGY